MKQYGTSESIKPQNLLERISQEDLKKNKTPIKVVIKVNILMLGKIILLNHSSQKREVISKMEFF